MKPPSESENEERLIMSSRLNNVRSEMTCILSVEEPERRKVENYIRRPDPEVMKEESSDC